MTALTIDNLSTLFSDLVNRMKAIYGRDLEKIILYGSVARGTAMPDSDIDIALIVKKETDRQHEHLLDAITDMNLDYDVVLSVIPINSMRFAQWEDVLPFYVHVNQDGITLWTAT